MKQTEGFMENDQPLNIGLSACFDHADPERPIFKDKTLFYAEERMAQWVMSRGDLAWLVPRTPPRGARLREIISNLDGLLVQGGSDVSPKTYGEKPLHPDWHGDEERDIYEIELINEAASAGIPILGICRGIQIINVAFGGNLFQDISTQKPGSLEHRDWHIYEDNEHALVVEEDSRLSTIYGGIREGRVNSIHHQAVRDLAPGFIIEAVSEEDNIVEAMRYEDPGKDHWIHAVQWHPEFQRPQDTGLLSPAPLLKDFLDECYRRKAGT